MNRPWVTPEPRHLTRCSPDRRGLAPACRRADTEVRRRPTGRAEMESRRHHRCHRHRHRHRGAGPARRAGPAAHPDPADDRRRHRGRADRLGDRRAPSASPTPTASTGSSGSSRSASPRSASRPWTGRGAPLTASGTSRRPSPRERRPAGASGASPPGRPVRVSRREIPVADAAEPDGRLPRPPPVTRDETRLPPTSSR